MVIPRQPGQAAINTPLAIAQLAAVIAQLNKRIDDTAARAVDGECERAEHHGELRQGDVSARRDAVEHRGVLHDRHRSRGDGAVREMCEIILQAHGVWNDLLKKYEVA